MRQCRLICLLVVPAILFFSQYAHPLEWNNVQISQQESRQMAITSGDIEADGVTKIYTTLSSRRVITAITQVGEQYQQADIFDMGENYIKILAVADIDQDDRQELYALTTGGASSLYQVTFNNGQYNSALVGTLPDSLTIWPRRLEIDDANNNGKDALYLSYMNDSHDYGLIEYSLHDSTWHQTILTPNHHLSAGFTIGDVDGDGLNEIYFTGWADYTSYYALYKMSYSGFWQTELILTDQDIPLCAPESPPTRNYWAYLCDINTADLDDNGVDELYFGVEYGDVRRSYYNDTRILQAEFIAGTWQINPFFWYFRSESYTDPYVQLTSRSNQDRCRQDFTSEGGIYVTEFEGRDCIWGFAYSLSCFMDQCDNYSRLVRRYYDDESGTFPEEVVFDYGLNVELGNIIGVTSASLNHNDQSLFSIYTRPGYGYGLWGHISNSTFADVNGDLDELLPRGQSSFSAYPNPSMERINIQFGSAADIVDRVQIFDSTGRLVHSATPVRSGGVYSWDGTNMSNDRCSSGVYFVNLQKGSEFISGGRVFLIR
jgi:Secretion system C-terminal sorting domain